MTFTDIFIITGLFTVGVMMVMFSGMYINNVWQKPNKTSEVFAALAMIAFGCFFIMITLDTLLTLSLIAAGLT